MLARSCGLSPRDVVADVGSGTGLLSAMFLQNGNRVFGVEPNDAMREAGEHLLGRWDTFTSLPGSAEDTGLDGRSVDLIAAGQAFHWFDQQKTRREFCRVLRAGGHVALIWNQRDTEDSLQRGYDTLMRKHAPHYKEVCHHRLDPTELARFFGGELFHEECPNQQVMDLEALLGRAASASYYPEAGQPGHQELVQGLGGLFARHEDHGSVTLRYRTVVFAGRLKAI